MRRNNAPMRSPQNLTPVPPDIDDKRIVRRYVLLTAALFLPLLFTFITITNVYPFAASTMMLGIRDKQSAKDYYILQGETLSGEPVDLRAVELTNALTGRNWSLLGSTVENESFNLRSPHPENLRLISSYGGPENAPRAARMPELLRAWGAIYNSRLPDSSNQRLKSIRVDAYVWEGGIDGEYRRFVESWTVVL